MQAKQYEVASSYMLFGSRTAKHVCAGAGAAAQLGRIRTLEDQLDKVQIALEEERDEKETILKNRQTNRLLMELREERVQRLQDLEEVYAKDKRLEAMAAEMSAATQGIHQVNEEIAHKDAELVGLRATARCSAKLLQVRPSVPFVKLLLKYSIGPYVSAYASSKEAALTRGHAIDIEHLANGVASLRARPVALMKPVGLHDRAVRKYRRDQIPNRALAGTASIASLQPASHLKAVRSAGSLPHVHTPGMPLPESKIGISRDCFQCTAATPLITKKKSQA
ncbi:hypothetical protein ON010_g4938 [Phytophthora cinnamomi]|nr:hypothetical protein ON010_g4938 [Phytophthora cinnamomi]